MNSGKPTTYTAEFRELAVRLANESDKAITQAAKGLGINVNTLPAWISKYSRSSDQDNTVRTRQPHYDELKRLKKEVARLAEECDLLLVPSGKKGGVFMSRGYFAEVQRSTARSQEVKQCRSRRREVRLEPTAYRRVCGGDNVPVYEDASERLLCLATTPCNRR